MDLFEKVLQARGLTGQKRDFFLQPDYDARHDPFLLPDMRAAVERVVQAYKEQQHITIYGDYDIDGLTATTVLLDALEKFGFKNVTAFIPNRFVEGYGMTVEAVEKIADTGTELIITVDCGSLSEKEIVRAKELGMDVIVTDHHNVAAVQPPAVAVVNPKRLLADYPDDYDNFLVKDSSPRREDLYPFVDLPGVGVAFKLVQALQTVLQGLPDGQEKWLLDLVALGTVCDVVTLRDENRVHVFWGLKVLSKTTRPGLRALMAVARVDRDAITSRSLGFGLGPRMNAAGRLETAQYSLDMLQSTESANALNLAQQLDVMNTSRKNEQDRIFKEAIILAEKYAGDNVLVVSSPKWNHGIIGIVAAKLLEKYGKPTFVLEEMGEEAKGSARSYGDFSAADAIRAADDIITKGGGHRLAAGVTLPTMHIDAFRTRINEYYASQKLVNQQDLLLPVADTDAILAEVTEDLVGMLSQLEPFGNGNPQPILKSSGLIVMVVKRMGGDGQHVKIDVKDQFGSRMQLLAFNAPLHFFVEPGQIITAWYQPDINEWNGRRSVEGRLLHLET
jgi:single-stranded-DNA-specific exonuclease